MVARRDHPFDDNRAQGGTGADARRNIEDFETLLITQSGPPPRFNRPAKPEGREVATVDYLCRFVASSIVNGILACCSRPIGCVTIDL